MEAQRLRQIHGTRTWQYVAQHRREQRPDPHRRCCWRGVVTGRTRKVFWVQVATSMGEHDKVVWGNHSRDRRLFPDDELGKSLVGAHHFPQLPENSASHRFRQSMARRQNIQVWIKVLTSTMQAMSLPIKADHPQAPRATSTSMIGDDEKPPYL